MQENKVFDADGAMARLGNDPSLLHDLVENLYEEYEQTRPQLESAIRTETYASLPTLIRPLKNLFSKIGATRCVYTLMMLEEANENSDLEPGEFLLARLDRDLQDFQVAYEDLTRNQGAAAGTQAAAV